jgi:SsrA-binding protein
MSDEIATNRKALRDYHILERYEAGVELRGSEVKSIRLGKLNISDAFARVERGQIWLYNMDIQTYEKANGWSQHEPRRTRRLLLHKREILKLFVLTQQKGNSLPVLQAYWKDGKVKMEIGVGKGKTKGDQREDLKEKAVKREAQRVVASFNQRARE